MMGSDAGGAFGPKDVVPVDERTGFCEESCTKSAPAGRLWSQRRGARRRKSKVLRGVKHHVRLAGGAFSPKDVVPVDERARFCVESCTKSAPAGRRHAKPCAGRAKK